jgi:parallel beta-helix repeat protein
MKLIRLFFLVFFMLLILTSAGCKKDKDKQEASAPAQNKAEGVASSGGLMLAATGMPDLSIVGQSVTEGNEGTTSLNLTVTCSAQPRKNRDVTVQWSTSPATGTNDAQATAGEDYTSASGVLTFKKGDRLQQDIIINIKNDTDVEADEMFLVTLEYPVNATISVGVGEALIVNDDSETSTPTPTFYVDDDGNDKNQGTRESPFATLAKGVSVLSAGDTLRVMPGNYMERLHIDGKSGTLDAPIIIKAEQGAILDGPDNYKDGPRQNIRIKDSSYVIVEGFEGRNSATSGVHIVPSASHITLRNLNIHGSKDHGVSIEGSDIKLENSTVSNNVLDNENESASQWGSGIKVRLAKNITLKRNRIEGNWGEGIAVTRSDHVDVLGNLAVDNYGVNIYSDNSSYVYIEGNFSYNSDNSNVLRNGRKAHGIATAEEYYSDWGNKLGNISIVNNIVYNCYVGFFHGGSSQGEGGLRQSFIYNNTFYNIEHQGIDIKEDKYTELEFKNNIIHVKDSAFSISSFRDDWNTDGIAQGVILENNLWVSKRSKKDTARVWSSRDIEGKSPGFKVAPGFTAASFQLSDSSPILNIGAAGIANDPLWNSDLEGNSRDISKPADLGALEHGREQKWFDAYFGL